MNILLLNPRGSPETILAFKCALSQIEPCNGKLIVAQNGKFQFLERFCDFCVSLPKFDLKIQYLSYLFQLCIFHKIDLLIPMSEEAVLLVSLNSKLFSSIGVQTSVSDYEAATCMVDKMKTYKMLKKLKIKIPRLLEMSTVLDGEFNGFPLILKPRYGAGSRNVYKVDSKEELLVLKNRVQKPILQDYINGDEYTIDAFVDNEQTVRCLVPRLRISTRLGEVSESITVNDLDIISSSKYLLNNFRGVRGIVNLQIFKKRDGTIIFSEMNPRIASGAHLSIRSGANFPKWIIEESLTGKSSANQDTWSDGISMNLEREVYIPSHN